MRIHFYRELLGTERVGSRLWWRSCSILFSKSDGNYIGEYAVLSHFPILKTPNSDSRSKRISCNQFCTYYIRPGSVGILRLIDLLEGLGSSLHVPVC